jgi:hypothetical protein
MWLYSGIHVVTTTWKTGSNHKKAQSAFTKCGCMAEVVWLQPHEKKETTTNRCDEQRENELSV